MILKLIKNIQELINNNKFFAEYNLEMTNHLKHLKILIKTDL